MNLDIRDRMMIGLMVSVDLIGLSAGLYLNKVHAQSAATDIPRHALYLMEMTPDKFVHPQPDPEGQWVLFENVQPAIDAAVAEAMAGCASTGATTDWAQVTEQSKGPKDETGAPVDERQLLCEVREGVYAFRDYINGQWRVGASTGPAPLAWAKIIARTEP